MTNKEQKMKEFGKYLANLRADKRASVTEVAKAVKISDTYLYKLEGGEKALIDPKYFKRLADFFDVPVSDLLHKAGFLDNNEKQPTHFRGYEKLSPSSKRQVMDFINFLKKKEDKEKKDK